MGFTVGGNANKKLVVSEEAQKRINKIFADSSSEIDDAMLNNKLDQMERGEFKTLGKESRM